VIDARIIFINSGPCMIPQYTTFLQLFKGDVLEENLRYECRDVEVCPTSMGSFQAVPAVPGSGGLHKFNINLTKASAMMDDEGIYRVRVRVFNPRNGFTFIAKTLSISIYGTKHSLFNVYPSFFSSIYYTHNFYSSCSVFQLTVKNSWLRN